MPWVPGLLVRILTHERAHVGQRRVADALFDIVQRKKLAGITVSRALEGATNHGGLRGAHVLDLSEDLPLIVEIVDRNERIEPLLSQFASLVPSGVLAVSDVRLYFPASALTVADMMQPPRIVARPDAPVSDVLRIMLDDGVRLIPVVTDRDLLVGIVTLGHLLRAADPALGPHLLEVRQTPDHVRTHLDRLIQGRTVRDIMIAQPHVLTLTPELTLEDAVRSMSHHHITRAPVVDVERRLAGLISERILISALVAPIVQPTQVDADVERPEDAELSGMLRRGVHPAAGEPLTAGFLADRDIPVLAESAHWEAVIDAIKRSDSCLLLVVTPEGRLRGVIDEQAVLEHAIPGATGGVGRALRRTLLRTPGQVFAVLRKQSPHPVVASQLLHIPPLAVPETMPVAEALAQMVQTEHSEWAVVVTAEKRPLGILRRNEALRALVST